MIRSRSVATYAASAGVRFLSCPTSSCLICVTAASSSACFWSLVCSSDAAYENQRRQLFSPACPISAGSSGYGAFVNKRQVYAPPWRQLDGSGDRAGLRYPCLADARSDGLDGSASLPVRGVAHALTGLAALSHSQRCSYQFPVPCPQLVRPNTQHLHGRRKPQEGASAKR